jgi:hypothetical protein
MRQNQTTAAQRVGSIVTGCLDTGCWLCVPSVHGVVWLVRRCVALLLFSFVSFRKFLKHMNDLGND